MPSRRRSAAAPILSTATSTCMCCPACAGCFSKCSGAEVFTPYGCAIRRTISVRSSAAASPPERRSSSKLSGSASASTPAAPGSIPMRGFRATVPSSSRRMSRPCWRPPLRGLAGGRWSCAIRRIRAVSSSLSIRCRGAGPKSSPISARTASESCWRSAASSSYPALRSKRHPRRRPGLSRFRDDEERGTGSARRLGIHFLDVLPVDEIFEERLEVVRAAVAVVDVIGVLPDVAAEDRLGAVHQRVLAVRRLHDRELAVLDGDPAPARSELRRARLDEVLLHLVDAAEVLGDLLLEGSGDRSAALRLHPLPEMDVVVVLAGVVEERLVLAERALHHLLDALALEFRALQESVAGVDVGRVMLVVVKLERLLRHVGLEGVVGIGQIGQSERHRPLLTGCRAPWRCMKCAGAVPGSVVKPRRPGRQRPSRRELGCKPRPSL